MNVDYSNPNSDFPDVISQNDYDINSLLKTSDVTSKH